MGYSKVRLNDLERVLGWSKQHTREERLEFLRLNRPRGKVRDGVWMGTHRAWHYIFRDGLRAIQRYLEGEVDSLPMDEIKNMGWALTRGRSLEGAPIRYDPRNCLRICEVVALVYALDEHWTRGRMTRKDDGDFKAQPVEHDVDG